MLLSGIWFSIKPLLGAFSLKLARFPDACFTPCIIAILSSSLSPGTCPSRFSVRSSDVRARTSEIPSLFKTAVTCKVVWVAFYCYRLKYTYIYVNKRVSHAYTLAGLSFFRTSNLVNPFRRKVATFFKISFYREFTAAISALHNLHRRRETVQSVRVFIDSCNKENSRHESNRYKNESRKQIRLAQANPGKHPRSINWSPHHASDGASSENVLYDSSSSSNSSSMT